jgi:RHS repeat-associated protein
LGRRIEKNVDGKITRYVYDNEDIILEYDGEGNLIAKYIHGPGIDEPIRMIRNQVYYYIADALGSIKALVDRDGFVRQMYEYDSFGSITQIFDEEGNEITLDDAIPNPYAFTGREYDPETGLYYYRARYYYPRLGRFLQEDPIRGFLQIPQSLSLYPYVENNPVNYIDPDGEIVITAPALVPIIIVGLCGMVIIHTWHIWYHYTPAGEAYQEAMQKSMTVDECGDEFDPWKDTSTGTEVPDNRTPFTPPPPPELDPWDKFILSVLKILEHIHGLAGRFGI